MIKLIASDIDGTLVEDGGNQINPELLEVIKKLRKQGIQFAAATGRQWKSIEKIFDPIKEKVFYLSDNGAYVGCHGRNLFLHPMEKELANAVIAEIRATKDLEVVVSGMDVIYVETKDEDLIHWLVDGYQFHIQRVADLLTIDEPIIKVSAYKKSGVAKMAWPIQERYRDKLKVATAGDMWMDFMASGVNKGEAIKLIQESLGILPEETMAFGDQLNDIEMLKQAYYSFAVGNARPEVKQVARFEADTNVKDGVLKILKLLV